MKTNKILLIASGVGVAALAAVMYYKQKMQPVVPVSTSENNGAITPTVNSGGYDGSGINPQNVYKPSAPLYDQGIVPIQPEKPELILIKPKPQETTYVDTVYSPDSGYDKPMLRGLGCYMMS